MHSSLMTQFISFCQNGQYRNNCIVSGIGKTISCRRTDFDMERNLCFLSAPPLPTRDRTRLQISPIRPRAQIDQATENPADQKPEPDLEPEKPTATATVCEGCGREGGIAPGCDGTGRIQGGLGVVVKWWPIKAYRPCPDYLKAKKKYQRAGQSLDEIAFGRKGQGDDLSVEERLRGD